MDERTRFEAERRATVAAYQQDDAFQKLSHDWLRDSMSKRYVYNLDWLGRPIIQYPQDIVAVQELIWQVRPDVVVETGIAHGGSLVLSASILALLDLCDATEQGQMLDPRAPGRKVVGVDIDIRAHNRAAIEAHPLSGRIQMIEGSSIAADTIAKVRDAVGDARRVLVFLDSMHTHDHVLHELDAYAPMVTPGSYCVVFDTFVENMPKGFFADRPWDVGNNPMTAIRDWLPAHPDFQLDPTWQDKFLVTVAPGGFLQRIR